MTKIRMQLLDNVFLTYVPADKFKTDFLSAQRGDTLRHDADPTTRPVTLTSPHDPVGKTANRKGCPRGRSRNAKRRTPSRAARRERSGNGLCGLPILPHPRPPDEQASKKR